MPAGDVNGVIGNAGPVVVFGLAGRFFGCHRGLSLNVEIAVLEAGVGHELRARSGPDRAALLDDHVAVGEARERVRRSCRSPGSTGARSCRRLRQVQISARIRGARPSVASSRMSELGIGHQGAADGEHLLLAAGELRAEIARAAPSGAETGRRPHRASSGASPCGRGAVATRFSSTVSVGKICRPSGTRPMPVCAIR